MIKSALINRVLLDTGVAGNILEANRMFLQAFAEQRQGNLEEWDTEVPPYIAETFLLMIDRQKIDVKSLMADLDAIYKKMS